MNYLLPLILAVPVFGAIVAAVIPRADTAKFWALTIAAITGALVLGLTGPYLFGPGYIMSTPAPGSWLSVGPIHFTFRLGVDAVSLFLMLMTVLLMVLAITASFDSITDKPRQYYAWMLLLLACMLGVFVARDLLLFYAFFELTLVPSFFLIGVWGGPERRYAAAKFFLFTFSASVFTLAAIVWLGAKAGTFELDKVVYFAQHHLTGTEQLWIAIGLFCAFVVKSAVFPLHTWLPIAYTEAPTPGTVILAGVMPKLGTYGILRLVIPIGLVTAQHTGLGGAFTTLVWIIGVLSVIGILYGALIAWVQRDMKRLLAYSSFSHLGFCVLGLMALNSEGVEGSVLYMVNHGISTGALFLCVGMIYDRYRSRDQYEYSGLCKTMPKLAFFFILFAFSSIGLPGLNGFVSEFLTILGAFISTPSLVPATNGLSHGLPLSIQALGPWFGALAALGMILAAIYMLQLVQQLFFGPVKTPDPQHSTDPQRSTEPSGSAAGFSATDVAPAVKKLSIDLTHREIAILTPLAVLVVVLGFFPGLILQQIRGPVDGLLRPTVDMAQPMTVQLPISRDAQRIASIGNTVSPMTAQNAAPLRVAANQMPDQLP
jgi:NADH-quinone oxidoreductase subunit M